MSAKRIEISNIIGASRDDVFQWFYESENFISSPIVFKSKWRPDSTKNCKGSVRDIVMIAGWYRELITDVDNGNFIQYKVMKSFPKVRQDFTEIRFHALSENRTKVTWIIEIEVSFPIIGSALSTAAGKMAKILYGTIISAGKKQIENNI